MKRLTQYVSNATPHGVLGGGNGLKVRLYPNGECTVYKPKSFKVAPRVRMPSEHITAVRMAFLRLCCTDLTLAEKLACALGLSPLPIFDRNSVEDAKTADSNISTDTGRARKGLTGITSHGARVVRNAAYLLQRKHGRAGLAFATVTVPSLPMEQMRELHERWHKVVELYRLRIRRCIESHGLAGEIVTVSEIQEKRYERTGLPVLHLHSVFRSLTRTGQWIVSIEKHDQIWRDVLSSVLKVEISEVPASCNIQRVKKSASAYLGKYMSKGGKVVRSLVHTELSGWIPKHWWNCSRSLRSAIDQETRFPHALGDWLEYAASSESSGVWDWHKTVEIEMDDGQMIAIARYGRLSVAMNKKIRTSLSCRGNP